MTDCPHNTLFRIEGSLHPGGRDYVCKACGEQFRAEELVAKPVAKAPAKD